MVKHIIFREKKLPVRIRYFALEKFQEETGQDFTSLVEVNTDGEVVRNDMKMAYFEPLLYYSLLSGAKAMREKEVRVPWEDKDGNKIEVVLSEENRDEVTLEILEECYLEFAGLFPYFFPTQESVDELKKPTPGNRQQRRQAGKQKR